MWEHRRVPTLIADILSRGAATIVGVLLFIATTVSLMRTVVVPRTLRSFISDSVTRVVTGVSIGIARLRKHYIKRDPVMAWAGPSILILQLITWLLLYLLSYGLLLYGIGGQDLGDSLRQAGSSLFTLGFADVNTGDQTAIDFIAAATGPIVIALMIGFLPTIYSSYLDREIAVTDLSVTSGEPAWAPEMLSRYTLSGNLPQINSDFDNWSKAAASMRMSHMMYPVLVWVRSARPYRHYLVSLLTVLDAAALLIALTKTIDRQAAFRFLIQGGQTMEVLYVMVAQRRSWKQRLPFLGRFLPTSAEQEKVEERLPGWSRKVIAVEMATDQDAFLGLGDAAVSGLSQRERGAIQLPREEFDKAVEILRRSGFPIERDIDEAWDQFTAARSRYEYAAYALCELLDATPAPWTGPRRWPTKTVYPHSALDLLPKAVTILNDEGDADDLPVSDEPPEPPEPPTS